MLIAPVRLMGSSRKRIAGDLCRLLDGVGQLRNVNLPIEGFNCLLVSSVGRFIILITHQNFRGLFLYFVQPE